MMSLVLRALTKMVWASSLFIGISACQPDDQSAKAVSGSSDSFILNPRHYIAYKTDTPIVLDGQLDEESWMNAAWSDSFLDIEGPEKALPTFETRMKILWDEDHLFIGAILHEPHIWANLQQRDTVIFYDNDFEVFIDPDWDTHLYQEIELNAFNTVWDLLLVKPYRDGGPAVDAWDINGFQSAVAINGTINRADDIDQSWSVEIAIPIHVLMEVSHPAFSPAEGVQWRINFSRVEWSTEILNGKYHKKTDPSTGKPLPENNWVWSPQGHINMHMPELWGVLQFSEIIAGNGTAEYTTHPDLDKYALLRYVYYHQMKSVAATGTFTPDLNDLNVQDELVKLKSLITWYHDDFGFTASIPSHVPGISLIIDEEGRVQQIGNEKRFNQ